MYDFMNNMDNIMIDMNRMAFTKLKINDIFLYGNL